MSVSIDPAAMAQVREGVLSASRRPDVSDEIGRIYAELAAEIETRRPVCIVSGRCCRFEEYGHRLFATTMELGAFYRGLIGLGQPERERLSAAMLAWDGSGCPFQISRLCGVHGIRPFGCRVYFCDSTAQQWQQDVYERLHGKLKQAHEKLGVPYFYVEWRQALGIMLGEPPLLPLME